MKVVKWVINRNQAIRIATQEYNKLFNQFNQYRSNNEKLLEMACEYAISISTDLSLEWISDKFFNRFKNDVQKCLS